MHTKKNITFLLLLFFFILTSRLYKISSVPSVISHDENYYPVQAKTIAVAFTDPSGTWNPLSLTAANPLYAELPGLIMAPASAFSNPLLAARFTHALLGSLLVLVLAGIAHTVTKNRIFFLSVYLIGFLNPWLFQFSRMNFDALFSLFFYFTGIFLFLQKSPQIKLLSVFFFLVGFFQYQGLKIVLLPLTVVLLLFEYAWQSSIKKRSISNFYPNIALGLGVVLVTVYFLLTLSGQSASSRASDTIFSDPTIAAQVQVQRQQTIVNPVVQLFNNKFTVVGQTFLSNYLASFNINQLFNTGESLRNPFSVWSKGMFYPLDLVLIVVGFFALYSVKKTRPFAIMLLLLILIAPLPSAINAKGLWIMFRSSLYVPVFVLLAGAGVSYLITKHKLIALLVMTIYMLFVSSFFYEYFFRYPTIGTSGNYFSERIVASYLKRNAGLSTVVLVDEKQFVYNALLHFNQLISPATLGEIKKSYQSDTYSIGSISIDNRCVSTTEILSGTTVIAAAHIPFCVESHSPIVEVAPFTSAIQSLIDSGEQFIIYNDPLCSSYQLGSSSHVTTDVFAIESLSDKEFCENFFAQTSVSKRIIPTVMQSDLVI